MKIQNLVKRKYPAMDKLKLQGQVIREIGKIWQTLAGLCSIRCIACTKAFNRMNSTAQWSIVLDSKNNKNNLHWEQFRKVKVVLITATNLTVL